MTLRYLPIFWFFLGTVSPLNASFIEIGTKNKLKSWFSHGKSVADTVKNVCSVQPFSQEMKKETALFVFDLDDTVVEGNYKGADRFMDVHLKPGVAETWHRIISYGHHVGIATYNVREVKDFLMKELGMNWRNADEQATFEHLILVEQPTIAERDIFTHSHPNSDPLLPKREREYRGGHAHKLVEGASELFKNNKGNMVERLLRRLKERKENISLIVFSDDKTRFHKQVLSKSYFDQNNKMIPTLGLLVGERQNKQKTTKATQHPSFYTEHLDWIQSLVSKERPMMNCLQQALGDRAALFTPRQIHQTKRFYKKS